MFNWKAEEMALKNSRIESRDFRGYVTINYPIESELSYDDKIKALDLYSDGKFTYFMNLNMKFIHELNIGIIKCGAYGHPKENSEKSWVKRNDTEHILWNGKSKDYMWINTYLHLPFFRYGQRFELGYTIGENKVNEAFNSLLRHLEEEEVKWFKSHDEYEIKLNELIDCGNEIYLNNHISYYSDGYVYVINEEGDKRKITLDEINILLDAWNKLQAYKQELGKITKITF